MWTTVRLNLQNASWEVPIKRVFKVEINDSLTLKEDVRKHLESCVDSAVGNFDVEVYDAQKQRFLAPDYMDNDQKHAPKVLIVNVVFLQAQISRLALPAKHYDVNILNGKFTIGTYGVYIHQVYNAGKGTGLTTWDGSFVLAKLLENSYHKAVQRAQVIELGAGTGLVGISSALLGARQVIMTDLEYALPNLQANIAETISHIQDPATRHRMSQAMTTQVVDWYSPNTHFGDVNYILASDVIWVEELIQPFLNTVVHIIQGSTVATQVFLAHQTRSLNSERLFYKLLQDMDISFSQVRKEEYHPMYNTDRITVLCLQMGKR